MGGGAGHAVIQLKGSGQTKPTILYNPRSLRERLLSLSKNTAGFDGLVNSLSYLPRGRTSSSGWFLTTRGQIEDNLPDLAAGKIQEVSVQFVEVGEEIIIGAPGVGGPAKPTAGASRDFTVDKLLAVKAYAVTGISEPNETAASSEMLESVSTNWRNQFYVVHVVDWRYFANLSCVTKAFNTRVRLWEASSSIDTYDRSALTGLSWVTLINDLWGLLPDDMGSLNSGDGSYPSSSSTSLNLKFWGMTAWDALWSILDQTFNTLVRELNGNWKIVDLGDSKTTTATERESNKNDLISISNDLTASSLPETVRVIFPKWDYQWQTSSDAEEPTSKDYWHNRPIWYIDKTTTSILGSSYSDKTIDGSVRHIHAGIFAQFGPRDGGVPPAKDVFESYDGHDPPDNDSSLQTHATTLATNYLNSLKNDEPILRESYRGFIDFTPTKELTAILWGDQGTGPLTRISNLPLNQEGKFSKNPSASGNTSSGGGSGGPSSRYEANASSSQRVGNEFPGSPDHARLDEPVLRWCIAQLSVECAPLVQVSATVKYGIPSVSSIQWDGTGGVTGSTKTILVNNVSTTVTAASGTRVFAAWNEQIRKWVFVPWEAGEGSADVERGGEICARSSGSFLITGGAHDTERWIFGHGWAKVEDYVHDDCVENVKFLRVNQDTFLRSYRRTEGYSAEDACGFAFAGAGGSVSTEMLISLDPSVDIGGSVFWSDGDKVRWTKSPTIGKEILLGDGLNKLDPPRIRFAHSETATLSVAAALTDSFEIICRPINVNLVTGSAPYVNEILSMSAKVILPNDAATFSPGQHLSVKSTGGVSDPNCLKLRWTAPGVRTAFEVVCDFNAEQAMAGSGSRRLHFDDGVLIGVSELGNFTVLEGADFHRTDPDDADCSYVTYANPDPCAVSHSH